MTIDPRLMERRKTVAEDKAKRNVGRLLKFLAFSVIVGALVWLVFSPWLSVAQVETSGVEVSSGHSILSGESVVAGTPMILINPAATEAALLEDPWIDTAVVSRNWPNRVTVTITERVPVAWTNTEQGWTRRAVDGTALPSEGQPNDTLGQIDMPELAEVAVGSTPEMLGALQFLEALPRSLHPGTVVRMHEGELWADVGKYRVRLGRGVEMTQKATSLVALLEESIPDGSTITLIAPTNPSVLTPGATDEAVGEGDGADTDTENQGDTSDGDSDG